MRKSENTIFHVHFSSPTAMGTAQRCVLFLAFSLAFAATAENSGPIAWWKMEAIENGKIHDASGNGRDLTVAAGVTTTNGLNGNGIWYDGTANAYSTFSCPAMTSRTVCVCFYPPSGSRPWVAGKSLPVSARRHFLVPGPLCYQSAILDGIPRQRGWLQVDSAFQCHLYVEPMEPHGMVD